MIPLCRILCSQYDCFRFTYAHTHTRSHTYFHSIYRWNEIEQPKNRTFTNDCTTKQKKKAVTKFRSKEYQQEEGTATRDRKENFINKLTSEHTHKHNCIFIEHAFASIKGEKRRRGRSENVAKLCLLSTPKTRLKFWRLIILPFIRNRAWQRITIEQWQPPKINNITRMVPTMAKNWQHNQHVENWTKWVHTLHK